MEITDEWLESMSIDERNMVLDDIREQDFKDFEREVNDRTAIAQFFGRDCE